MDLADLTAASFEPHSGSRFHVTGPQDVSFDVTLVEVTESSEQGHARRQFSLVFRGGPAQPQPQGIHRLEHDVLGTLDIFLVPIGPDADGQRYEAAFS